MDINGYLDLIPSENSMKEKFMGFMEAILSPVIDLQNVVQNRAAFDVNEAAGDQLDIIGEFVGVRRELTYVPESGTPYMTDDEYALAIQLRIAQESWDGTNGSAAETYENVVGNRINIDYEDGLNGTMSINVDKAGQDIAQKFSSAGVFLVPAGVDVTIVVNDEPATERSYYGIAVTGEEYELTINLVGGES